MTKTLRKKIQKIYKTISETEYKVFNESLKNNFKDKELIFLGQDLQTILKTLNNYV